MTEAEKRRGGGAKTSRSETVTVRLEPRVRYLAELAARVQRRTLSSYIEWAVEESLAHVSMHRENGVDHSVLAINEATPLWDVHEADRFCILASSFPQLLKHDEQLLWKLIREVLAILRPASDSFGATKGFRMPVADIQLVRKFWTMLSASATGEIYSADVAQSMMKADLSLDTRNRAQRGGK